MYVEKRKEDWFIKKWRPAMGWMYMTVCLFDFIVAPILWSILQAMSKGQVTLQWQPLTLQGAGLFHVAMGAVLGITSYGRTKEKLNGSPPSEEPPNKEKPNSPLPNKEKPNSPPLDDEPVR
jgi:hypothetical protein